jgi:hypothetical protein
MRSKFLFKVLKYLCLKERLLIELIYKTRKPIISHMPEENKLQSGMPMPSMPPAPSPPRRPAAPRQAPPSDDSQSQGSYPPLFIKIDKYKDIVQNLQRLKSYALSLRDALDALDDIEKELKTGIQITQKALDDFNAIIAVMDAKLIRLTGGDEGEIEGEVPEHMDDYIKGVYDQIAKIRDELRTISS